MQREVAGRSGSLQPDIAAQSLEIGALEPLAETLVESHDAVVEMVEVQEAAGIVYEGGAAHQVARNSVIQSIGKLFSYGSGLVIVALTTRLLTQTDYGNYTIAVTYLGFVFILADLGIGLIAVREASRAPERLSQVYTAAMSLKLLVSLVVFSAAVALIFFMPYDVEVKIATSILAASMVLTSVGTSYDIVFQSRLQMQTPTLAEAAIRVVSFVATASLFLAARVYPLGNTFLFYGIVGTVAVANIVSFLIRRIGVRRLLPQGMQFKFGGWGPLLRMALPMGIVTILGQVHYKADTIILSLLQPPAQVAIYGVAYKVLDFMLIFFGVFVATAYPVLARYAEQSQERLHAALVRVLNMCFSVAVPATVGVILLAPEIVELLGGGRYPKAALPLQILSLAMIFSTLNMVYNYLIIVQNRQRILIWVSCVSVVANVALNVWAIPRYSYLGSAVATDITEGMGMVLGIVIAMRVTRVGPSLPIMVRVVAACVAMCIAIEAVRLTVVSAYVPVALHPISTLALIGLGASIYFITLYLLGGADESLVRIVMRRVPILARLSIRHVVAD